LGEYFKKIQKTKFDHIYIRESFVALKHFKTKNQC
jgi:hypothetical protein